MHSRCVQPPYTAGTHQYTTRSAVPVWQTRRPQPANGLHSQNVDLHGNIDSLNPRPRVGDWRRPQSFGSSGDHLEGHSLEPGKIAWARPTSAPLSLEGLAACPKYKTKTEKKNRLPQTKNLLTNLFWTTNLEICIFSRGGESPTKRVPGPCFGHAPGWPSTSSPQSHGDWSPCGCPRTSREGACLRLALAQTI